MITAAFFLALFAAFAIPLWFAFFGAKILREESQRASFPVLVTGWETRLTEHPPFKATVEDIAFANEALLKAAANRGYEREAVRQKLNNGLVRWVAADPSLLGKRAIVDPYGRKHKDGSPLLVAGWHLGDHLHVVYLPDDKLADTAYCHEMGHEIHELRNTTDYEHMDEEMWGNEGIVALAKSLLRSNR